VAEPVKVSVRGDLDRIIKELEKVRDAAQDTSDALKETGQKAGEEVNKQVKKTETFLGNLRNMSRRVADQMKDDFKALLSINALGEAMKLSNQFKDSIRESVSLSNTIRKLGQTFGMASGEFADFQAKMTKGLGTIGLSSEAAANALTGLAETPVRGQEQLIQYSKQAGGLARASGQQGQEGRIAAGIANLLVARGVDPNDLKAMKAVSDDLARVRISTGKGPTETLGVMQSMFERMPEEFRKSISTRQLASLAAAGQVAGPQSTKFLETLLSKSSIARQSLEAQGFKNIFGKDGINIDEFKKASKSVLGRSSDPRMAAQTLGLSEDEAEGFVRLARSLDQVSTAQAKMNSITEDQADALKETMGLGEAFEANINRVKSAISKPLSALTQGMTDLLSGTSKSDTGATAAVLGGGVLAAMLAGFGLKGIGGTMAKGAGAAALTGKGVQPVYVVNAAEIAAGGALSSLGGLGGKLGKIGGLGGKLGALVSGAGALATSPIALGAGAIAGGGYAGAKLSEATKGTAADEKVFTPMADSIISALRSMGILSKPPEFVGAKSDAANKSQTVYVKTDDPKLKITKQPTRGASN
jgi:hypothetical protein